MLFLVFILALFPNLLSQAQLRISEILDNSHLACEVIRDNAIIGSTEFLVENHFWKTKALTYTLNETFQHHTLIPIVNTGSYDKQFELVSGYFANNKKTDGDYTSIDFSLTSRSGDYFPHIHFYLREQNQKFNLAQNEGEIIFTEPKKTKPKRTKSNNRDRTPYGSLTDEEWEFQTSLNLPDGLPVKNDLDVYRTFYENPSFDMMDAFFYVLHNHEVEHYVSFSDFKTKITFSLSAPGPIWLSVFDIFGREVKRLKNMSLTSGNYEYSYIFSEFLPANGVYFYKIITPEFVELKTILVIR